MDNMLTCVDLFLFPLKEEKMLTNEEVKREGGREGGK